MTNYDVVMKLIGKISPVGESNTDEIRFENFKELKSLTEQLINTIESEIHNQISHEYSVKRTGDSAKRWFELIGDTYFKSHLTTDEINKGENNGKKNR